MNAARSTPRVPVFRIPRPEASSLPAVSSINRRTQFPFALTGSHTSLPGSERTGLGRWQAAPIGLLPIAEASSPIPAPGPERHLIDQFAQHLVGDDNLFIQPRQKIDSFDENQVFRAKVSAMTTVIGRRRGRSHYP